MSDRRVSRAKLSTCAGDIRRPHGRKSGARPSRKRLACTQMDQMEERVLLSVGFQFDYALDVDGFLSGPTRVEARALFEQEARGIASQLYDELLPVPLNTSEVRYGDGGTTTTVTYQVPSNTIVVYAYGAPLGGRVAARCGPLSDSSNRGQIANDFAPNAINICFDDDGTTDWYFGSSGSGLSQGQTDFVNAIRHEFLHGLGLVSGIPSFDRNVIGTNFAGPNATAANGGSPVPLEVLPTGTHIASSVSSVFNAFLPQQRTEWTPLELGMLSDIGWTVGAPSTGQFYRRWSLFVGGATGETVVEVHPERGVYLMQVDVVAGAHLELRTNSPPDFEPVQFKLFDAEGRFLGGSSGSGTPSFGGGFYGNTFGKGGTYYVGVSIQTNANYTFSSPAPGVSGAGVFSIRALLTFPGENLGPENAYDVEAVHDIGASKFHVEGPLVRSVDFYSIATKGGEIVSVSTSGISTGGLLGPSQVTIYDRTGSKIVQSDPNAMYGTVSFTPQYTGQFYVAVSNYAMPTQIEVVPPPLGGGGNEIAIAVSDDGEFGSWFSMSSRSEYELSISTIPPVQPISVSTIQRRGMLQAFSVQFSDALDPQSVSLNGFRVALAGRDKRFGTRDDRLVALKSVSYDPASRSVRVIPRVRGLSSRSHYRLLISDSFLKGTDGRTLDGDRDGVQGGAYSSIV